jgi:hypothetical protein
MLNILLFDGVSVVGEKRSEYHRKQGEGGDGEEAMSRHDVEDDDSYYCLGVGQGH